ncbi:hypothetical protein MRB53_007426 [Persea americana]|uniref:Uncharacterized protein n=1 Tax=Persea americana TaxID=3435 RepID=A0ACC2MJH9_PERAE|nr:hypothetical protein MRB53_007426 [Persea americana]
MAKFNNISFVLLFFLLASSLGTGECSGEENNIPKMKPVVMTGRKINIRPCFVRGCDSNCGKDCRWCFINGSCYYDQQDCETFCRS